MSKKQSQEIKKELKDLSKDEKLENHICWYLPS